MAIISDTSPARNEYTLGGDIMSLLVSIVALPTMTLLAYQRSPAAGKRFTVATMLCLLCYALNFIFIWVLTFLGHVRWPPTNALCNAMVMTCVIIHNIARASEFAFLVERAYIISWPVNSRIRTKEYVLSTIGIFAPYIGVTAFAVSKRIANVNEQRICIVGTHRVALFPMLTVELLAQLYLTLRFLLPLLTVHKSGCGLMLPLKKVMAHAAIGSAITLLGNVAVKSSLALFNGENITVCYVTCKLEALLDACILHWITKPILNEERTENGQPALAVHALGSDQASPSQRVLSSTKSHITSTDYEIHLGQRYAKR